MGSGNWQPDEFRSTSTTRASKPREEVFTARSLNATVDPSKMVVRESRDSADHPRSNAIIVGFDVTGSMGQIPYYFAHTALGQLMDELLKKLPVPDPQLLVAAVGDSTCDSSPLQVGQFESDNRIDQWLTSIYLEGGGGGTGHESYGLVHHFAGRKTSIDCAEKRGQKGFLFTIGDELPHAVMGAREIQRVFGDSEAQALKIEDAIASATTLYDVIHILVKSNMYDPATHIDGWRKYLGENVLVLRDFRALPELIMTTIGVRAGMRVEDATKGFGHEAHALVLSSGVGALTARGAGEIVRL